MRGIWRPFFWEPVEGTGERLMAAVVGILEGQPVATRVLRDDVLDALYGSAAGNPKVLIEHALTIARELVIEGGQEALGALNSPILGLQPGPLRNSEVTSAADLLRQACLLYSSLAHLDGLDVEDEDEAAPPSEDANKRFTREVREQVLVQRPALRQYFNREGRLNASGSVVRFGFLSDATVIHFSVLHPVRQPSSVRFARAKLWELARAKEYASLANAVLVTALPNDQDPTLGPRQIERLAANRADLNREAQDEGLTFAPVNTIAAAVDQVLALT